MEKNSIEDFSKKSFLWNFIISSKKKLQGKDLMDNIMNGIFGTSTTY